MALTTQQIRNNAVDGDSTARIAVLLVQYARAVFAEDGGTANHAERVAFARAVVANPEALARQWVWYLLTDSGITTGLDVQLTAAITAAWNTMAGV